MRAKTVRVDRWEKTPTRTAQDKIKIKKTPAGSSLAGVFLFCTNLTQPTGNLDSKSSAAVIESFLLAKEKMNATILMVTHDAIAASYADRVVALSDGKIVKELLRTAEPRQFMNEILDFLKVVEVSR